MPKLTYPEIFEYIDTQIIKSFYEYRVAKISEAQLIKVLKRKNPYLFKAKNITTAQDLVTEILQAHISSQEETVFGNYLEELATDFSVVLFRPNIMLASEEHPMKPHENQCFSNPLSQPAIPWGATNQGTPHGV